MDFNTEQKLVCKKYRAAFVEANTYSKVGVSKNLYVKITNNIWPINGLRHNLDGDTTGWYIWAGEEFSYDADFFLPLHLEHFIKLYPVVIKFLGLAPGWRFLIADNYEDVWEDLSLLDT